MKVYVVKEIRTWRYMTETRDFINDLRQADLFLDYEVAQAYCPSGCEVVEVQLMETKDIADYTKQVRKEVLGELCNMLGDRAELIDCGGVAEFMFTTYDLSMCVEEILGEEKGETECQKN